MKHQKKSVHFPADDYFDNDTESFKNKKSHKLQPVKKEKSKNFMNSIFDNLDDDDNQADIMQYDE
ncbi:MAG: hypothetical protein NTW49_08220 [Bacteroidia bacterium]|nr:hypothetical protein [Bacteroidia bacterium]